jgi:putative membrane protein
MCGYSHGYGLLGMIFGLVSIFLFWALLIMGVMVLAKHAWRPESSSEGWLKTTAIDILKERYARGEINREEFEQKKHDLEN